MSQEKNQYFDYFVELTNLNDKILVHFSLFTEHLYLHLLLTLHMKIMGHDLPRPWEKPRQENERVSHSNKNYSSFSL